MIDNRASLAGYPAGTYELWVNDEPENYTITPNPGLGTAESDPPLSALDLDGNGQFVFSSDGILLLAHSFGVRGDDLEAFSAPNMTRNGTEITDVISELSDALDFDGDGVFQFSVDGILLLAFSFGIGADDLEGFAADPAIRTGTDIVDRFQGLLQSAEPREQSPEFSSSGQIALPSADDELITFVGTRSPDGLPDVPRSLPVERLVDRSVNVSARAVDSIEFPTRLEPANDGSASFTPDQPDDFFSAADELASVLFDVPV